MEINKFESRYRKSIHDKITSFVGENETFEKIVNKNLLQNLFREKYFEGDTKK